MASVTVRATFDAGHRLPNHQGLCRSLHGHTYTVEVAVSGSIISEPMSPKEGMVTDFTDVKQRLKAEIDKYDHKFLLYRLDPLVDQMSHLPGVVIVNFVPTAENIAQSFLNSINEASSVRVWETRTSYAEVSRR